jgi:hypothetical protein
MQISSKMMEALEAVVLGKVAGKPENNYRTH